MPKLHSAAPTLDRIELAAVLAGLRLLQIAVENDTLPPDIEYLACDGGEFSPITTDQIDTLCDRINYGE